MLAQKAFHFVRAKNSGENVDEIDPWYGFIDIKVECICGHIGQQD
jgi:hypothetical protein